MLIKKRIIVIKYEIWYNVLGDRMKNNINSIGTLISGIILGVISRLLDIYTQNLGNIFSGINIWILFGVIISIYSKTKKQAMINIFSFCIGMIFSYYLTMYILNNTYNFTYIIGWTLFALFSPFLACFTSMIKEKRMISKIISFGIIFVSILSTIILFDRLRSYDYIIISIMIYYLFFNKKIS